MRSLPSVLGSLLGLLAVLSVAAPLAAAQDPDGTPGCTQDNPCEVILEVDAQGISDLSLDTFASGDWILFSIYNSDEQNHTLRLEGHYFQATIGGGDLVDTQPFRLGSPGVYKLSDEPTGDKADITVEKEDEFSSSASGSDGGSKSPIPAPGAVLLVGLLAALALLLRRK